MMNEPVKRNLSEEQFPEPRADYELLNVQLFGKPYREKDQAAPSQKLEKNESNNPGPVAQTPKKRRVPPEGDLGPVPKKPRLENREEDFKIEVESPESSKAPKPKVEISIEQKIKAEISKTIGTEAKPKPDSETKPNPNSNLPPALSTEQRIRAEILKNRAEQQKVIQAQPKKVDAKPSKPADKVTKAPEQTKIPPKQTKEVKKPPVDQKMPSIEQRIKASISKEQKVGAPPPSKVPGPPNKAEPTKPVAKPPNAQPKPRPASLDQRIPKIEHRPGQTLEAPQKISSQQARPEQQKPRPIDAVKSLTPEKPRPQPEQKKPLQSSIERPKAPEPNQRVSNPVVSPRSPAEKIKTEPPKPNQEQRTKPIPESRLKTAKSMSPIEQKIKLEMAAQLKQQKNEAFKQLMIEQRQKLASSADNLKNPQTRELAKEVRDISINKRPTKIPKPNEPASALVSPPPPKKVDPPKISHKMELDPPQLIKPEALTPVKPEISSPTKTLSVKIKVEPPTIKPESLVKEEPMTEEKKKEVEKSETIAMIAKRIAEKGIEDQDKATLAPLKQELLFEIEQKEAHILHFERQIGKLKRKRDQLLNPKSDGSLSTNTNPSLGSSQNWTDQSSSPIAGLRSFIEQIHRNNQESSQVTKSKLALLDVEVKGSFKNPEDYPFWQDNQNKFHEFKQKMIVKLAEQHKQNQEKRSTLKKEMKRSWKKWQHHLDRICGDSADGFPENHSAATKARIIANAAEIPRYMLPEDRPPSFIDQNRLVPNTRIKEAFNRQENTWFPAEEKMFVRLFRRYHKDFERISKDLPNRDVKACIKFYYLNKNRLDLKSNIPKNYINRSQSIDLGGEVIGTKELIHPATPSNTPLKKREFLYDRSSPAASPTKIKTGGPLRVNTEMNEELIQGSYSVGSSSPARSPERDLRMSLNSMLLSSISSTLAWKLEQIADQQNDETARAVESEKELPPPPTPVNTPIRITVNQPLKPTGRRILKATKKTKMSPNSKDQDFSLRKATDALPKKSKKNPEINRQQFQVKKVRNRPKKPLMKAFESPLRNRKRFVGSYAEDDDDDLDISTTPKPPKIRIKQSEPEIDTNLSNSLGHVDWGEQAINCDDKFFKIPTTPITIQVQPLEHSLGISCEITDADGNVHV